MFEGKERTVFALRLPPSGEEEERKDGAASRVGTPRVNRAGTGDGAGCDDASTTSAPGWCHLKS